MISLKNENNPSSLKKKNKMDNENIKPIYLSVEQ